MKCKHERGGVFALGRGLDHLAVLWCSECGAWKTTADSRWTYPKIWRTAQKKEKQNG